MHAVRAYRRLTGWIAALAILLAALAPTLSHALASAAGSNWVDICTTEGAKSSLPSEDGGEHAPPSAHLLEHCPYCTLHVPSLGLPPVSVLAHVLLPLGHAVPIASLSAPRTRHAWTSAHPRAPPLFS